MPKSFLTILLATSAFAQSPQFEVASIKPFDPSAQGKLLAGVHVDGAQIHLVGLPLRALVAMGYRIKATLITGPDWTETERFNILATLPAGGSPEQLPEMMQALLYRQVPGESAQGQERSFPSLRAPHR